MKDGAWISDEVCGASGRRPRVGQNYGVVMNLPAIVWAYAVIRPAEGKPFRFSAGVS
jgi:hypothetical protein